MRLYNILQYVYSTKYPHSYQYKSIAEIRALCKGSPVVSPRGDLISILSVRTLAVGETAASLMATICGQCDEASEVA